MLKKINNNFLEVIYAVKDFKKIICIPEKGVGNAQIQIFHYREKFWVDLFKDKIYYFIKKFNKRLFQQMLVVLQQQKIIN